MRKRLIIPIGIMILTSIFYATVIQRKSIVLPDSFVMEITNESGETKKIETEYAEAIRILLRDLKETKEYVYEEPTYIIKVYDTNNVVRNISLFMDLGYVYDGYFLDAWYERMVDKKSRCFQINYRLGQYINDIMNQGEA